MNSDDRLMNSANPTWDYATVWNSLQLARAGINDAIQYMTEMEDITSSSDLTLRYI